MTLECGSAGATTKMVGATIEQFKKLESENITLRARVRELEAIEDERCEISILYDAIRMQ